MKFGSESVSVVSPSFLGARRLQLDLRAPDELEEADLAGPLLGEGASLTFRRKLSRRGQKEWCDSYSPCADFVSCTPPTLAA